MKTLWGILGIMAVVVSPTWASVPIVVDFAGVGQEPVAFEAEEPGQWKMSGEVDYESDTQTLRVRGRFLSMQDVAPEANWSYRILSADGDMLQRDGQRYALTPADAGGLVAEFVVEPGLVVAQEPGRVSLVLAFSPVLEGQFWYWKQYPEMDFPVLEIRGLPARDHYVPMAAWVPRFLPAGMRIRLPAWWRVEARDVSHSGYRPSIDMVRMDGETRVGSARVTPEPMVERGAFVGLLPVVPQEPGELLVRPGLVWDGVRWYEAPDWYARQPVCFVSPLWYMAGLAAGGAILALLGAWCWRARWSRGMHWLARGLHALGVGWWLLDVVASGFWMAGLCLGLTLALVRLRAWAPQTRVYALTWVFMVYVDYFWGHQFGGLGKAAHVQVSATVFAAATWALLLLPLLAIRRLAWQVTVAGVITAGWWLATTVGVVYYEFFRDFPSVGDLFYAGQIGELGDSVAFLTSPGHWVPLVQWGLMVAVAATAAATQRKTQAENT